MAYQITSLERIEIYDHLTPELQELLHSANNFKTQHDYKFCWAKIGAVLLRKNETSRLMSTKEFSVPRILINFVLTDFLRVLG